MTARPIRWSIRWCGARGHFFTVIGAGLVFGEHFAPLQWLGLLMLVGGIFGFAAYNLARVPVGQTLWPAMGLALVTGMFVAAYTTYDAWGIRAAADPFTFLAWFFHGGRDLHSAGHPSALAVNGA